MKYALAVASLFCVAILAAQSGTPQNAFTSDQIKWGPAPPFVQPGAQIAVLEGDPTASSGDFTIRIKMPNGYKVAPHWHPKRENVTVLAGTLKVGMGDTFDASKMMDFSGGKLCLPRSRYAPLCNGIGRDHPADSRHVAGAVQLHQSGG